MATNRLLTIMVGFGVAFVHNPAIIYIVCHGSPSFPNDKMKAFTLINPRVLGFETLRLVSSHLSVDKTLLTTLQEWAFTKITTQQEFPREQSQEQSQELEPGHPAL